jgi:chromosome segregation ATPase
MERKEPTLGGLSARDEHDEQPAPSAHAEQSTAAGYAAAPPTAAPQQGPGVVAVLALLVAIAGIAGSGYLAWQLTESQKALADAEQRVAGLETRLSLNSSESSQTVDQIQDKLKWADSEIRKLWGVSQDTNRKRIVANEDAVVALKRQLKAVEKRAASAGASANSAKDSIKGVKRELQAKLDKLSTQLAQADKAAAKLQENSEQMESLSIDVQRVSQQLPGLRDLASRVKSNEEAVAAIDTYRRNTNNDILKLKRQLKSLSTSAAP